LSIKCRQILPQRRGGSDRRQLLKFLDKHAATMLRTLLRYSLEHLDKGQRELPEPEEGAITRY
jgi:hypothetical protein